MKSIRCLALSSLVLIPWLPLRAQESTPKASPAAPRNITTDDYFQIRDVSQPEISLDGQWVVYAVRTRMLKEDKNEQRLWMVSTHGGDPIPLTAEVVSSSHPRWSSDGKYLAFLSARNNGKTQVWLLNRLGGEAAHLTDVPQGVDDFEWSPDSTRLVLILRNPKPEDLEAAKDKDKDKPAAAAKPKTPPPFVIDRLQFKRDTVGYLDRRRTHLYVFDVASKKSTQVTSATSTIPSPPGHRRANHSLSPAIAPLPIPTPLTTRTSGSSPRTIPTKGRTSRKSPPIPALTVRPPGLPTANGSPSSAKSTSRP